MKSNLLLLLLILTTAELSAERWDITMKDGTTRINIERCWYVGATLFIVIDDSFYPVNISDIDFIKQYREVKAPFNKRRAWSYAQTFGIGGILVGILLGTGGESDQAQKMQRGIKTSLGTGSVTAFTGYIIGGILGSKRIRIVNHDLSDFPPGKKIAKVRFLLKKNDKQNK